MRKIKSQVKAVKIARATRITFALNADLCQQAENWLNSQWVQQNFTFASLSELIRKSLVAYQNGEIKINPTQRDKHAPKREITIRFFNADLLNFYYSLPYRHRTGMVEESLRKYLERLSGKEIYELFTSSLKATKEKLKKCSCKTSEKVRVGSDNYAWCEKCEKSISVASKKRVIKNRNDPKFWGLEVKEKVLCGNCLTNYQDQMPVRKKYLFSEYLKRGRW